MFTLKYFNNRFFEMRFFTKGYLSKFAAITSDSGLSYTAITGDSLIYNSITSDGTPSYIPMEQE